MSPTVQAIAICCDPSQQVITILIHGVSADAFFGIASDTVVSNTNIARSFFIDLNLLSFLCTLNDRQRYLTVFSTLAVYEVRFLCLILVVY